MKQKMFFSNLRAFYDAVDDETRFTIFSSIVNKPLQDWAFDSSIPIEEDISAEWINESLFQEPVDSVSSFKKRTLALSQLHRSLRMTFQRKGKHFKRSELSKIYSDGDNYYSFTETSTPPIKIFKRAFTYTCSDPIVLFSLGLSLFVNEINSQTSSTDVFSCAHCGFPFVKVKRQLYCSVECRTVSNNKKRDPKEKNEAESRNRKLRLIKKIRAGN